MSWPVARMALALLMGAGAGALRAAVEISDVEVVNVTPSGFSIVFRASAPVAPGIAVYADALGIQDLAGQLGVEPFPIHTGDPGLDPGHRRRASVRQLQARLKARSVGYLGVSKCAPGTTYFYRVRALDAQGGETWWPAHGPLPSVTTARETVMVPQARRLLVQLEGEDVAGEIVVLTADAAAYPLAAVVGDGAAQDEALFNLPDFLAPGGQTNQVPLGTLEVTARLPVEGPAGSQNAYTLDFSPAFMVAATTTAAYTGREFVDVTIESIFVQAGDPGALPIRLATGTEIGSVSFRVSLDPTRLTDLAFADLAPEIATAAILPAGGKVFQISFDTASGQVFSGSQTIARLTFRAVADRPSAFLPLQLSSLSAFKPGGESIAERYGNAGRIVVIGREPLLETVRRADGSRALDLFGRPGFAYVLETSPGLGDAANWTDWRVVLLDDYQSSVVPPAVPSGTIFYRARELIADPPRLEAVVAADGTGLLILYGLPGAQYRLESALELGPNVSWHPVRDITLTNAFVRIQELTLAQPAVFFRVVKP